MMMGIVELVGDDILHLADNQKTAEFFGTTPEAMANNLASENGAPKPHIQMWVKHYREAERTAAPVSFEYPHQTPQGERWLLATVCRISLSPSSGRPRFSYIVEDITARKVSQAQLQQNLAREQTLAQLSERMRQTLDLETIFRTTTEEVRTILNCDRVVLYQFNSDWSGKFVFESAGQEWLPLMGMKPLVIEDTYLQQTSGGRYRDRESLAVPDIYQMGFQECHVQLLERFQARALCVSPIFQGQKLWGLLAVYQNSAPRDWQSEEVQLLAQVGDRLNSVLEQKVQERTARLEKALNFEAIAKGIIERVRDSLDESQILATVVHELVTPLQLDRCQTGIYDLQRGTSQITYEYSPSLPKNIEAVYNFSELSGIYDQLLAGYSVQFSQLPDVLRLQLLESVSILACPLKDERQTIGDLWLFRLNHEAFSDEEIRLVEQVAASCAIAIRQARLYHAAQLQVEELERLNLLKDDFLKTISHELRTPLTNIEMGAETLKMLLEMPDWREKHLQAVTESLEILEQGCQKEIELVNDLLELVHLDARTKPVKIEPVDINLLISYIVPLFSKRTKQQQQLLTIDVPEDLPLIETNPNIIERILTELLNNACKYTPQGENITVSIELDTQILKLTVANSGIELSNIELERIFERFYRILRCDRWQQGGTGLGLALVKKQAEYLGGTIKASNQNQQLVLTVDFPVMAVSKS